MRNSFPYAVLAALPPGQVSTADAVMLFGEHFDHAATYVSDGKYVRRVVTDTEGLNFVFTGERCPRCNTYSVRKLRPPPRGSECLKCIKLRERRRKARREAEKSNWDGDPTPA